MIPCSMHLDQRHYCRTIRPPALQQRRCSRTKHWPTARHRSTGHQRLPLPACSRTGKRILTVSGASGTDEPAKTVPGELPEVMSSKAWLPKSLVLPMR